MVAMAAPPCEPAVDPRERMMAFRKFAASRALGLTSPAPPAPWPSPAAAAPAAVLHAVLPAAFGIARAAAPGPAIAPAAPTAASCSHARSCNRRRSVSLKVKVPLNALRRPDTNALRRANDEVELNARAAVAPVDSCSCDSGMKIV